MSEEHEKPKKSQAFERLKTLMFPSVVAGFESQKVASLDLSIEDKSRRERIFIRTIFYPGQNNIRLSISRRSKTVLAYTLNSEGLKSLTMGSLRLNLGGLGDFNLDGEIHIGGILDNHLTLQNTDDANHFGDFADKLVDWTENLLKNGSLEELPAYFRTVPSGK